MAKPIADSYKKVAEEKITVILKHNDGSVEKIDMKTNKKFVEIIRDDNENIS